MFKQTLSATRDRERDRKNEQKKRDKKYRNINYFIH